MAAVRAVRPQLAQFASFDTAFHHGLPRLAQLMALPREMHASGIRRYGFHGLSYEYVVEHLRRNGVNLESERIIVAHLGNGASMCALRQGRSVETTMGFSTLAGLMMGTRCGDLDPGVVLYLLKERGLGVSDLETLLYKRSGLLGVSGRASDMSELLAQQGEAAAREAVDLFCYVARHHLAALTATLGGLDRLVFTGGIGANAPEVRARICQNLGYLGISLDDEANCAGRPAISAPGAAVAVDIVSTDEELVIARHVRQLCATIECRVEE
jgi:acetate kinase